MTHGGETGWFFHYQNVLVAITNRDRTSTPRRFALSAGRCNDSHSLAGMDPARGVKTRSAVDQNHALAEKLANAASG
jgi:hypothetical protein